MRTVAFYTLGCKVNQYETDALAGIFKDSGYRMVGFEDKADVYVINTCTVTSLSDRKSRQMIRRARNLNKDAIVVAAGCYAQTSPDEVGAMEEVNLVLGTKERASIMDYIKEIEEGNDKLSIVGDIAGERKFEDLKIDESSGRTRAHIKIQEGCSQFCAYCIIPYARGPVRSRQPQEIVMEAGRLSSAGFKEIVLTGIHIASYGKDIGSSLGEIIKRVHEVHGIDRIRLGSVEPNIVTDEFLKIIASCEKLCPHFHVSLQSGCNETLKRMNRKYTSEQYKRAVALLREAAPDSSITTDVMVGFPGETSEEFGRTFEFLKEIAFSKMHVFKYSPRKGTPAATFPNQVHPSVKEERSNIVLELSNHMLQEFNKRFLGRVMPVLFEEEAGGMKGFIEGYTENYIRVICEASSSLCGNIQNVMLEKIENDFVVGRLV